MTTRLYPSIPEATKEELDIDIDWSHRVINPSFRVYVRIAAHHARRAAELERRLAEAERLLSNMLRVNKNAGSYDEQVRWISEAQEYVASLAPNRKDAP